MKRIILASASPRRKQLLESLELSFETIPSSFEESLDASDDPQQLVEYLSFQKAQDVATKYEGLVIAADTIVVINGTVFGKPKDTKHAKEILKKLSGRSHQVLTGYTIIDTATFRRKTKVVSSTVYFKELSDKKIDEYIESGEPMDKAGAYGIQGLGSIFVDKIEGDYFNVIGLPIKELKQDLELFDVVFNS